MNQQPQRQQQQQQQQPKQQQQKLFITPFISKFNSFQFGWKCECESSMNGTKNWKWVNEWNGTNLVQSVIQTTFHLFWFSFFLIFRSHRIRKTFACMCVLMRTLLWRGKSMSWHLYFRYQFLTAVSFTDNRKC